VVFWPVIEIPPNGRSRSNCAAVEMNNRTLCQGVGLPQAQSAIRH
jgi:hypothetical protein